MTTFQNESEIFRHNLLFFMKQRGFSAASLSKKAGLNARAVKDIEERRTGSPRLSTMFKLARALEIPPDVLIGLRALPEGGAALIPQSWGQIEQELAALPQSERESILQSLRDLIASGCEPEKPDTMIPTPKYRNEGKHY